MRTFECRQYPNLMVTPQGAINAVRFQNGLLATEDPEVIAALEANPWVTEIGATTKAPKHEKATTTNAARIAAIAEAARASGLIEKKRGWWIIDGEQISKQIDEVVAFLEHNPDKLAAIEAALEADAQEA